MIEFQKKWMKSFPAIILRNTYGIANISVKKELIVGEIKLDLMLTLTD
jgi:hypothetical protein